MEDILHYFQSGVRKYGKCLQKMEHVEGASAATLDKDVLTINDLPDDMIINIFSMLDIVSLLQVPKVCSRWQQLLMTPCVWKYARLKICYPNCFGIIDHMPVVGRYLRHLNLNLKYLSEGSQFISHCSYLTHLEINVWEVGINWNIFDYLPNCPNLKSLRFLVRGKIQPRAARNSTSNMPFVATKLKTLELVCYPNTLEAAQFRTSLISYCPNLTHFEIDAEANRSIFDDLHHLPDLKFLSFYGILAHRKRGADHMVKDSAYNLPFEKLKYLETLILSSFSLTRSSLYNMLKCENLVNIDMQHMRHIPADFLEDLLRTKQATLRELNVYGDTLNDDVMMHISNCGQLKILRIRTCDTISDSSLLNLSRLKNLQQLELFSGKFSSSAMVEYLTKNTFEQMKCLRVPGCFPLTPQVIDIINANAPNIERFYYNDYLMDKD